MRPQGWFVDPFDRFGERWFSDGHPTSLVRNGTVESHDEPPSAEFPGPLAQLPGPVTDGSDLRRADDVIRNSGTVTKGDVRGAAVRVGLNPFDGPM